MNRKVTGENIRILRENAGFTQGNLAEFLHVDQSLISKIEKGERSMSTETLNRITDLFGVTLKEIQDPQLKTSALSFALRGSTFTVEEMDALAAINRIALNCDFMQELLKGNSND